MIKNYWNSLLIKFEKILILVLRFSIWKVKRPGCLFSFIISKLDGWKCLTAFVIRQKNWVLNCECPKKFEMKFPFLIHSKISNFQSFRGFFASFYFTMRWPTQSYTYIPSTINTWPMFWHTKWDWMYGKMINHGLFSLPFNFFEWKCILNSLEKFRLKSTDSYIYYSLRF